MTEFIVTEFLEGVGRLKVSDVAGTIRRFTGATKARYTSVFQGIGAALPTVPSRIGAVGTVRVNESLCEIELERVRPTGRVVFPVQILRGGDGLWRIDGM